MKSISTLSFATSVFIIIFIGCNSSDYDTISVDIDNPSQKLLKKVFEYHGALDLWKTVQSLSFDKETILYHADSSVEMQTNQSHAYQYFPHSNFMIQWQDSSGRHMVHQSRDSIYQMTNGAAKYTDKRSLTNMIAAGEYAGTLPYKIMSAGNQIRYEGDVGIDGESLACIRVQFLPAEVEKQSEDIWWHYFDVDTGRHWGYRVKHADHFSLVKNFSFVQTFGIKLPTVRQSYRITEDGQVLYLRADYKYDNYQLTFR